MTRYTSSSKAVVALLVFALFLIVNITDAQKAEDLFVSNDTKISWLGIDFSHVKLIGQFAQFGGAGEKNASQIKSTYFPGWNYLIPNEREKYDIAGMLRKDHVYYDIDMIMDVNAKTAVEELESYNAPQYTREDIEKFVGGYDTGRKEGIGVLFVAESLNKATVEAWFHFVAINMKTREVLVHDRLRGEPSGLGIRNYWAGAIHDVITQISRNRYRNWRSQYAQK
jgi:hypothetical protein